MSSRSKANTLFDKMTVTEVKNKSGCQNWNTCMWGGSKNSVTDERSLKSSWFLYFPAAVQCPHRPQALTIAENMMGVKACILESFTRNQPRLPTSLCCVITSSWLLIVQRHVWFPLHRTYRAQTLGHEPLYPKKPTADKRGLFCCQDNATAAFVKSQGYCVFCFFAGLPRPTYRGTLQHKHKQRRQRAMTELDASTPLKPLLVGEKMGLRVGG